MSMTIFEISQRSFSVKFQVGFCHSWAVLDGILILKRPFERFHLHSAKGLVQCRGPWTHGAYLPEEAYYVASIQHQPWMDLDLIDVLSAMDVCAACAIDLPPDGYSRNTIL